MTGRQTSTPTQQEQRADLVLRCVELWGMAWWLFDNETNEHLGKYGQIAAQLLDLAELLEVADRQEWWAR